MTITLSQPGPAADDEYLDLVRTLPLRRISDDAGYDAAAEMLEKLTMRRADGGLTDEADAYFDALTVLVGEYDARQGQVAATGSLTERMAVLVDTEDAADRRRLAEAAGVGDGEVVAVLAGRRGWSKAEMKRLSERLKLRLDYFMD